MNHFFHVNGPVFTFLSKFCDVLIISILWTLFCLPVVTVGPACAALYHTVHKSLLKSDGYILPTSGNLLFQPETRDPTDLLCLFISVFCVLSYFFITAEGQSQIFVILYFALLILAAFLLLVLLMYSFPILSRFYMRFSVIF